MLSRMLNCCQRLEKLTFPSMRSGFPRWTKVKSCRMRPLEERRVGVKVWLSAQKEHLQELEHSFTYR